MDEIANGCECLNGVDYRRKERGETIKAGDIARSVKNAFRTWFVEKSLVGEKITLETENKFVIFTTDKPTPESEKMRDERETRFLQKVKDFCQ